ncbi:hypothetical protein CTH30272_01009 [Allocatenococcus thiocycli]|nr:hypothetical protein CTH30272_01009 [Catenococcus thiocycli]
MYSNKLLQLKVNPPSPLNLVQSTLSNVHPTKEMMNMKKQFNEQKIITILKEAQAGIPSRELGGKYRISDATSVNEISTSG